MEKIRIITDSASDLSASTREDLTILPLAIRFGDTEYLDGVTISHHEFYEKLIESDTLPTTSLVSPAAFEEVYARAVADGETLTDDCAAVERIGMKVSLTRGDRENIKLTTPFDLMVGEAIIRQREGY